MATKYRSDLTSAQMQSALHDMNNHISEAWAVGKRNGTAVINGDETYNNNAKYYSDRSAHYADIASRANVPTGDPAVRYDLEQQLTSAEKAQAKSNIGVKYSNPNLLDNWWLAEGVINQRGQAEYTVSSGSIYSVDRWLILRSIVTLTDNGITLTRNSDTTGSHYLQQRVPNLTSLIGKTVTLSIMLPDGTVKSKTKTVTANTIQADTDGDYWFDIDSKSLASSNAFLIGVGMRGNPSVSSITIKAVKLEIGTESTLANDFAPNYAEELAKCQRYYIRYSGSGAYVGSGIAQSATIARILTPTPIMAKSTTDIRLYGTLYIGSANGWGANAKTSSVISNQSKISNAPFAFYTATVASGFTAGDSLEVQFRDATSYLEISADL